MGCGTPCTGGSPGVGNYPRLPGVANAPAGPKGLLRLTEGGVYTNTQNAKKEGKLLFLKYLICVIATTHNYTKLSQIKI